MGVLSDFNGEGQRHVHVITMVSACIDKVLTKTPTTIIIIIRGGSRERKEGKREGGGRKGGTGKGTGYVVPQMPVHSFTTLRLGQSSHMSRSRLRGASEPGGQI